MTLRRRPIAAFVAILLSGCAGVGVVSSKKDPMKNVKEGREYLKGPERAATAERLIWEGKTAFEASNNHEGQAESYMAYAEFLTSPALSKEEAYFRSNGFRDKTVTFDNRLEKSVEYLDNAAPLFFETKRFDALTNISVMRGVALMNLGKADEACASFDQAVSFHEEQVKRQPEVKATVPEGHGTWKEYLSGLQKWAGCAE